MAITKEQVRKLFNKDRKDKEVTEFAARTKCTSPEGNSTSMLSHTPTGSSRNYAIQYLVDGIIKKKEKKRLVYISKSIPWVFDKMKIFALLHIHLNF